MHFHASHQRKIPPSKCGLNLLQYDQAIFLQLNIRNELDTKYFATYGAWKKAALAVICKKYSIWLDDHGSWYKSDPPKGYKKIS